MKVIDIQYGEVATDPFCSQRLDLGFSKDHNGDDLPLYIAVKQALEQSLRAYFQKDLTRRGERFLVTVTGLPYMPCVGSEIKVWHVPNDEVEAIGNATSYRSISSGQGILICRPRRSAQTLVSR